MSTLMSWRTSPARPVPVPHGKDRGWIFRRRIGRALRSRRAALLVAAVVILAYGLHRFPGGRTGTSDASRGASTRRAGALDVGPLKGTVLEVTDGDSVTLTDGRQIRYLAIDCPEAGRPGADEARRLNQRLVRGKSVRLSFDGMQVKDRYGRLLALVYAASASPRQPEICINEELILQGAAWTYFHDSKEASSEALKPLIAAQKEALKQRRGVWREWLEGPIALEPLISTPVRIHRQGCLAIGDHPAQRTTSLIRDLAEGRSPCRRCRPLERR